MWSCFKGPESWNDEYKSIRSDNSIVRAFQGLGSIVGLVPPDENDLVKRVVAVGGQTVQCLSEEEGLRVNGKPLTEPYIDKRIPGNGTSCQGRYFGPVHGFPTGNLWVMGDNRAHSKDSRFHLDDEHSGTVPIDNVIGKVQLIVLPFSRWGTVSSFDPQWTDRINPGGPAIFGRHSRHGSAFGRSSSASVAEGRRNHMRARRITANLKVADVGTAKSFYSDFLGLSTEEFNMGWVARYTSPDTGANVQLVTHDATAAEDSVISVHTDDVDGAYEEARRLGYEIVHPITTEEWGVRRFLVPGTRWQTSVQHRATPGLNSGKNPIRRFRSFDLELGA